MSNSITQEEPNLLNQIIYIFWTYFHSVMIQTYFHLVAIIMWS